MRVNHQTRSLHYFNTFAVQDRIPTFDQSEQCVNHPSLTMHDFLPSAEDYTKLQSHFTVLVSRIMCSNMEYFNKLFGKCLTYHIPHQYSTEMTKPSKIVSVFMHALIKCNKEYSKICTYD